MPISNAEAIRFALTPGAAETVESEANRIGNMGWAGMAKGVKYARNAFYISVALTTIAAIGAAFLAVTGSALFYAAAMVAILGVGLTVATAKRLYDATLFLQSIGNMVARSP